MNEPETKQPAAGEWEAMDWPYPQAEFAIYDDGDPHGELAIIMPGGQLMECGGHADLATDLRRARFICDALNEARRRAVGAAASESAKAPLAPETAFAGARGSASSELEPAVASGESPARSGAGGFGPSEWLDLFMRLQDGRVTCIRALEILDRETISMRWVGEQHAKTLELCWAIEALPASEQQTALSVRAADIAQEMQRVIRFGGGGAERVGDEKCERHEGETPNAPVSDGANVDKTL